MLRAFSPTALRAGAALGLLLGLTTQVTGQTTIYNSNGFESPTYTTGNLTGQAGFQALPTPAAGIIQTGTVSTGTQAFQVVGTALQPNAGFGQTNFWYQSFSTGTGFNPVAQSMPYVQVQFKSYTSGAFATSQDIPLAGIHLEGFTSGGAQQSLAPIMVNSNGGVSVFTNTATSSNNTLSTANDLLPRQTWSTLMAELNFNTQTFRVYKNGDATPMAFQLPGGGTITDVPFRNSFGSTTQIAELGMLATYTVDPFSGQPTTLPPQNNFFIDDFTITASATPFVPVPEPSLVLAAGAIGVTGWRVYRRRKVAVA